MTLPVKYILNPAASHIYIATTWVQATISLTWSIPTAPLLVSCSYTYSLLSILNTGAIRVILLKLVRTCYKSTQDPAMTSCIAQNKSQYPYSGSLEPVSPPTSILPLVHSTSVSLASLLYLKHIWLRILALTISPACRILP